MLRVTQLSGFSARAIVAAAPGNKTLSATGGSYALTGTPATLTHPHSTAVAADAGSYSLTGTAATVVKAVTWTTAYSKNLTVNSGGWAGYNMRQVIGPSELLVNGTAKIRVTLKSATGGSGMTIDFAEIGHAAASGDPYDFDGGQIALTFSGGSSGCSSAGGGVLILSDEMTFTLDKTKSFIVAVHFTGASSTQSAASTAGALGYYKSAANEVSVANVSGYSSASNSYIVSLIEVT